MGLSVGRAGAGGVLIWSSSGASELVEAMAVEWVVDASVGCDIVGSVDAVSHAEGTGWSSAGLGVWHQRQVVRKLWLNEYWHCKLGHSHC